MIKKCSILLLFSIVLTVANFTLPYLWYYSNYEYVSTELCIHQHRTDHECNGMCQLKLRLHNQHNQHGHAKQIVKSKQRIDLFTSSVTIVLTPVYSLHAFTIKNKQSRSLWIDEPTIPPPQTA